MPHDHAHRHDAPADLGPAFRLAVALNAGFVVLEAGAGLWTGSLALLADAAHNLTDVAGLLIAWGAAILATRPGTARFTWGFGRATVLAALANAIAILIGVGAVAWESIGRLGDPPPVAALPVVLVALAGIGVNVASALLFAHARKEDLNAEGAFQHMAADAAVSVGVVLAGIGVMLTGWRWLDPAAALAVSALIAVAAWRLLRAALRLGLDGVPAGLDHAVVAAWLAARPGVADVHDLHLWALSTTRTALTAHLVWRGADSDAFLRETIEALENKCGIGHATLQLEAAPCGLRLHCVGL